MNTTLWIGFAALILSLLIIDLFILHKKDREVSIRRALIETGGWIAIALIFNLVIYYTRGAEKATEYLTAYIIEKSLSVDNLFVFIIIFSYYNVPKQLQHRVLFWGIIGTVIMRGIFIFFGIQLIDRFDFLLYFLGAFLIYAGVMLLIKRDSDPNPQRNPIIKLMRKYIPVFKNFHGNSFIIIRKSGVYATPLLIVLIVIETTDIMFAMDSVPAILAITRDPLIVYTSNIFAILGLRSLYFALAGVMNLFHLLKYGLGIILVFIGVKIFGEEWFHINIFLSLGIVVTILLLSVILSVLFKSKIGVLPSQKSL